MGIAEIDSNDFDHIAEQAADALIEEGMIFVDDKTVILPNRMSGKTLIQKAKSYDQMKHRAEVWEQATRDMIYTDGCFGCHARFHGVCPDENLAEEECLQYIYKQAEKELHEEKKDE